MEFEALLNSLFVSSANSLGLVDIILVTCLPFALSFPITWTYRFTQRHTNFSIQYIQALMLFAPLTAVVTLLIGSNIARAFGLVGALSIIRFRTALKTSIDSVYIFWALAVGMACGTGFYLAATLVVILCMSFILIIHYSRYGQTVVGESLLRVMIDENKENEASGAVENRLKGLKRQFRLINVLFDSAKQSKTYLYLLQEHKRDRFRELYADLEKIDGVEGVQHQNNQSPMLLG